MPYVPYNIINHRLIEGTKIRFAGQEMLLEQSRNGLLGRFVDDQTRSVFLPFEWFDFEIFIQPLTIPKTTKDQLMTLLGASTIWSVDIKEFLNSLEVTND